MRYCLNIFTAVVLLIALLGQFAGYNTAKSFADESVNTPVARAVEYLRLAQLPNGAFQPGGVGPAGIILTGLMQNQIVANDPMVAAGLDYLLNSIQEDGGIYSPGGRYGCYETNISIVCLALAKTLTQSDRFDAALEGAERYVRAMQYCEETETDPTDPYYGGLGYGNQTRPDLSNTQFFLDALRSLETPADDPAMKRALLFVSRCQNYRSEIEASPVHLTDPDGGFFYTCVEGGESKAGQDDEGALRSYGSMTYAGLKSLIYAGLTADDPRVIAATDWLRRNYSLETNPGMGESGLYYYYQTMAKSLAAIGNDLFADSSGNEHLWKQELLKKIAELQRPEGCWFNDAPRWMESDPCLVTGYVLLTIGAMR